jgi:hypothetical protein
MWPLDSKYMPPRYDSLEESMVDDENSEDSISENTIRNWQKGAAVRSPLPWIVSTFVFAALSSYLYLQQWRVSSLGTFERGFSTDFGA